MLDTLSERLPLRFLTQKEQKKFMNTYSHKRSIGIVLLVCAMIFSMVAVTALIDAGQKRRPGTVSPSGEINTWWDDVTDYMDAEELIERFLESIGALKKSKAELENDRLLQQANSVRADKNAKEMEDRNNALIKLYDASYQRYSDAQVALILAKSTIISANEKIADVNDQLDAISRRSWRHPTGQNYYEMVDQLQQQKTDLIAKRNAAEADIPMQEAIMSTENALMWDLSLRMAAGTAMINHYIAREVYHDKQIDIINKKIAAIDAQIAAEKAEHAKLQSDYASKDDDEQAGPGESPGLSHTSTDTTIDLGETHSFKVITEGFYDEVNWYIQRKDNTGRIRWLYSNSGGNNANKAEVNIEFSSDNGIEPYTVYVLTARVTRVSDNTTYDIIYEISIGP